MKLSDQDQKLLKKIAAMKADKRYMTKLAWFNRNQDMSPEEIMDAFGGMLFFPETDEEKRFAANARNILLDEKNDIGSATPKVDDPTQVNPEA